MNIYIALITAIVIFIVIYLLTQHSNKVMAEAEGFSDGAPYAPSRYTYYYDLEYDPYTWLWNMPTRYPTYYPGYLAYDRYLRTYPYPYIRYY